MTSNGLTRLNGFVKITVVVLPFVIAGLVAWGTIRSDVRHVERALNAKADAAVVATQYDAILRELQRINARLDGLERRR